MKNTAVTEFLLVLATVALTGILAIGSGGDPACENGDQDPTPTPARTATATLSPRKMGARWTAVMSPAATQGATRDRRTARQSRQNTKRSWTLKSGCVMPIGETMTATVEGTADDHVTTFDGACRIALPFRGKYPNTALKAGPTDGVSATAEISNGGELIVDVNGQRHHRQMVYE